MSKSARATGYEGLTLWRKLAAAFVDAAILATLVYAGRILMSTVLVFLDGLIRRQFLGQSPITDARMLANPNSLAAQLRRQQQEHPVILGQPLLTYVLISDIGPAILILLFFALLQSASEGRTPGRILFERGPSSSRGRKYRTEVAESAGEKLAAAWFGPSKWNLVPQADALIFYLVAPVLAAIAALVFFSARQQGKPRVGGWFTARVIAGKDSPAHLT